MPLETGVYVNNLVASNPPGTDPRKEGANHIRLIKSVLRATFPTATRAFRFPTVSGLIQANYSIQLSDQNALIRIDAAVGPITVTLPLLSAVFPGWSVMVQRENVGDNTVTIQGSGGQLLNASAQRVLRTQFESALFIGTGSDEWREIRLSQPIDSWPIGSLFTTSSPSNPADLLGGGVWELLGEGEVIASAGPNYPNNAVMGLNEWSAANMPQHQHSAGTLAAASGGAHGHTGTTDTTGAHTHTYGDSGIYGAPGQDSYSSSGNGTKALVMGKNTGSSGNHAHTVWIANGGAHPHSIVGATEHSGSAAVMSNMQRTRCKWIWERIA